MWTCIKKNALKERSNIRLYVLLSHTTILSSYMLYVPCQ